MTAVVNKIAFYISVITHPVFLFLYILVYLLLKTDLFLGITEYYKIWLIITYLVLNSVLIPLAVIYFLERDFNINDRKRRTVPYMVMVVVYLLIYIFFIKFSFPEVVKKFLLSITIGLCILMVANHFMKISMHSTSAGAAIALFLYLYLHDPGGYFYPLTGAIFIGGLTGTSRLLLKVHTNLELYLGYLLGFLITTIILF